MIQYDKLYLCAPKCYRTKPTNKKSNEENFKRNKKPKMLRRSGPVIKSVESVQGGKKFYGGKGLWKR